MKEENEGMDFFCPDWRKAEPITPAWLMLKLGIIALFLSVAVVVLLWVL